MTNHGKFDGHDAIYISNIFQASEQIITTELFTQLKSISGKLLKLFLKKIVKTRSTVGRLH